MSSTDTITAAPSPHSFSPVAAPAVPDSGVQLSTVIVDSIAADTISGRIPHFIPVEQADSLRVEALIDSLDVHAALPEAPSGAEEGIAPMAGAPGTGGDTALTALLMGTLVLAALNAGSVTRAIRKYGHELWSVRRRPNVFDNESNVSPLAATLLQLVTIIFGGIVLYNLPGLPPSASFFGAVASMALLGAYTTFLYCSYSLTGYAFADASTRRRWLGGFLATQAWAGLLLIVPALLLIVEPEWRHLLIIISLSIYFCARILFIVRGVRIFYTNFQSLLYFILYLCTLEIIPLFAVYHLNDYLWAYTA
ncbi:MAG: DUF4271 domain-containing protein [Muribaculaceae bacterium]|nr:DUF4271 domain-containing protein [Muribaculaceae bacterium]